MEWIKRNPLAIIIVISSLIILTSIFFLVNNFYSQNLSSEMTNWGSFGSYLSGTLGVMLSLINVIILYRFSKVGERFNKENLTTQIKSTVFNSFIETLRKEVDRLNKSIDNKKISISIFTVDNICNYLNGFKIEKEHLLDDNSKIDSIINEINGNLISMRSAIESNKLIDLKKYNKSFYNNRAKLISELLGLLVK
jgi:hypothetical protein